MCEYLVDDLELIIKIIIDKLEMMMRGVGVGVRNRG